MTGSRAEKRSKGHKTIGFVFWAQRKPIAILEIYKAFQDRLTFLNGHMIVWFSLIFSICEIYWKERTAGHLVFWKPWPVTGHIATAKSKYGSIKWKFEARKINSKLDKVGKVSNQSCQSSASLSITIRRFLSFSTIHNTMKYCAPADGSYDCTCKTWSGGLSNGPLD